MNNQSLSSIRDSIDEIDNQILALLQERAGLALSTKALKMQLKKPAVFSAEREYSILKRLVDSNKSLLSDADIRIIFQSIMNACRQLQQDSDTTSVQSTTISVQGDKGSFSEYAAERFLKNKNIQDYTIVYALTSKHVLEAITQEVSTYGVLAINNASGGLVKETVSALEQYHYRIIDAFPIQVRHCLLVRKEEQPDRIQRIYSHPQALRQCKGYLKAHYADCEQVEWQDTAHAARMLGQGQFSEHTAVIASKSCADYYDLLVLQDNIQDLADNDTLFLVVQGYYPKPHISAEGK